MQTKWIYQPGYDFGRALPFVRSVHGFVLDKPSRIRRELVESGVVAAGAFEAPPAASEQDLAAVHAPAVIAGLRQRLHIARAAELLPLRFLPVVALRRLIVAPQLRACGGTALALEHAAGGGWAMNLGGGFHHARPDLAHGFCLVNDIAWGIERLRHAGVERRILVLDLDLHQGDGNAAFFRGRRDVFTVSLHQQDTFPFPKLESDIDVGLLGDETGDDEYHRALDALLPRIASAFAAEIVVYVAGTDPYHADGIGSFRLSEAGLLERDRKVAAFARAQGAALVALTAGGYSPDSPHLSAAGFAAMAALAPG